MPLDKSRLPDPASYYEAQGLRLIGPRRAQWKTTRCEFHGGSDSLRINTETGAFVCMAGCGTRGGDVLAYHMAATGTGFVQACKDLGAWVDDGTTPPGHVRAAPLPARAALELLAFEAHLVAIAAGNIAYGVQLSDEDRCRMQQAAGRIQMMQDFFQ
ncbi:MULTISPECIES: hypothetical protein [Giesbergeria]|uniref:Zinc finger CHC2-type domain-containing protein n=1 Tax=Giesbergeria sinuosa TaxID=80883 RepID=A0ABV9QCP3_9BURK